MKALLLALLPGLAHAAAPLSMTHQGRLLDANGGAIDGDVALRITLYDTQTGEDAFWTRLYPAVPVEAGYYAVALVLDDGGQALDPADFADGDTWVAVEVGGAAAGGRVQLGSVPYALAAGNGGSDFFCSAGGGTWCPEGFACTGGTCAPALGMAASHPASTCDALHQAEPDYPDGVYWLDPDGVGVGADPHRAYCLMEDAGGGWTLVARVNGADANTLLYSAWTGATLGTTTDFSTTAGGDVLYDAYGRVPGSAILFYDDTAACGTDKRLLQTGAVLGGATLRSFLSGLAVVNDTGNTATNHFTPDFRNTGCTHPFRPNQGTYFTGSKLAINTRSAENHSVTARFTVIMISWDAGIGGSIAADGSYGIGDLDIAGDGVNNWSGHVVTVFVK